MLPYRQGSCVEQSDKIAKFAKCLQVFKEFGRVHGLKYLCSVEQWAHGLESFYRTLKEVTTLGRESSSPLK